MSANLIVDLGATALSVQSACASGGLWVASGATAAAIVGAGVDMLHADTYTALNVAGHAWFGSGQLRVLVQTSDTDVSGTYTDPTSGLPVLPTYFQSGGVLWLNSGSVGGGLLGAFTSGQAIASGFNVFAGFQRPHRYARALVTSGLSTDFFAGDLMLNFVGQYRTTGSGGGYTLSPTSGTVNV